MTEDPFDRFDDIDDLIQHFDEVFGPEFARIRKMLERTLQEMQEGDLDPGEPFVYGFTMRMGPDGTPHFDDFGNVRSHGSGVDVDTSSEGREPLTDVIEGADEISITAELPGVAKDDIQLTVADRQAKIHVDSPRRRYFKTVELPARVDPDTTKATYRNGVLDITIKKIDDDRGRRITID